MNRNEPKLRLPRLIGDGMVMQRNASVNLWGWAPPEEVVTVHFNGKVSSAAANADGEWLMSLRTEDAGGSYEMSIETGEGAERIVLRNILLGDVWLCSGQSNMEMKMASLQEVYAEEIALADNDFIRQFQVPVRYDFEGPHADLEAGSWEAADPGSVLNFTAAGYFFAAKLYEQYGVPIGLIVASLGGAPAEAFMSADALAAFPDLLAIASRLKDPKYADALTNADREALEKWQRNVNLSDAGMPAAGQTFYDPGFDASDWPSIQVPSYWADEGLGPVNGVVWFRKEIEVPASFLGEPATLVLGHVVDENTVYLNGTRIGTTPSQYAPSKYAVPDGLLRAGLNTLVVRVVNYAGKGGFYPGKPYELRIGSHGICLDGAWSCKIGVKSAPLPKPAFIQWQPTGLYNGMIAPLVRYPIKGVIWYQGETNAQNPETYERLFKNLIADWRKKRGQGDFPFLYVQLPNYMERSDSPAASHWAQIREAQRKTLAVPATGMAVTIDIGEWNDVHPTNKKDVGSRLALAARKIAYGDEAVIAFGPLFQTASRRGNRIVLRFSDTGGGLTTIDGGPPRHFAIAGADRVFQWANAEIEDDGVAVWHDRIFEPVYARYAWADNPEGANLCNREGLMASPFSTE